MKKVIGVVTSVAALVLLSYYGTGLITEHTIKKNLSLLDQSSGLSAQITDYHRGLFTSKVNLTWKILTPERFVNGANDQVTLLPSKTYTVEMPIIIYHGPVIYSDKGVQFGLGYANSQVAVPESYQAEFSDKFTSDSVIPKLDLSFFVTYTNKMLLHVDVPAFRLVSKQDKSQFQWLGMKSEHTFSSNMNEVEGDVVIDGARFSQAEHTASMSKLTSTYDIHRSSAGLYLGDVTVNIPVFEVTFKDQKILDVQVLQLTTSSDVEEGLFGTSFHAAFEKAFMHEKTYGPGRLSFAIKNLDAETLVDMNKKMNDAQHGTDAARQQAALAILPDLPKLFGKGATIELSELNVVGPEGELDGSVQISLPKSDTGNAFQLMQKVEGEGKVKLPEALLSSMMVRAEKAKLLAQQESQQQQQASQASTEVTEPAKTDDAASKPAAPASANVSPSSNTAAPASANVSSSSNTAAPASANVSSSSNTPVAVTGETITVPVVPQNIDEQAKAAAKSRITNLINVGAIVQKGTDYVIDVKLSAGQISVNGRPLSAEMLQF